MFHSVRNAARIVVVAALAVLCAAAGWAQDDALRPKIAIMSLTRVQSEFTQLHEQESALNQWVQSRRSYLDELTNFVFLPKKELEEAVDLVFKDRPLPEAEQTRLADLRRISDKNDQRFSELRASTERSAEENAEFSMLQDMYDASIQTLRMVQESLTQDLGSRRSTALVGLMDIVQQAVVAVAEEGGYDLVLDADMVFHGGDDITDAVIARLNGGSQPPAAGAQGEQGGEGGGEQTGDEGG